jgi:hypothetical protein
MPRGKKKAGNGGDASSAQAGNGQTSGGRVNKMACVRQALHSLGNDARPKDIQDFLQREFQLHMDTKMISTYKGSILKAASRSRLMRAPAARARAAAAAPNRGGDITVEDIRAVKELGDRIGVEKVRAIMDVLYE